MLINYHWDGSQFLELREPVASWHIRFLRLFELLQDTRQDQEKYQATLGLLSKLLFDAKVVDSLIPVEILDTAFVNSILELFAPQELPTLDLLTELLEDKTSTEYIQSSNNFEAYWLNTLHNLFGKKSLDIWKSTTMSTIQAMVFEARQSLLLNSVKEKLTPEAIQNRQIEKMMRDKIKEGVAFNWIQEQVYPEMTTELNDLVKEKLNDLRLD